MSSTHALRGRLSRSSEICSMGDWLVWGGGHQFFGFVLRRLCMLRGFLRLSHLGLILGRDFVVLPFLLVFVTSIRVGVSVTLPGLCLVSVALTTRPPWTTWSQPGPSLFCLAGSTARFAVGAAARLGAPLTLLRSTDVSLVSLALASSTSHNRGSLLYRFLHICSTQAAVVR